MYVCFPSKESSSGLAQVPLKRLLALLIMELNRASFPQSRQQHQALWNTQKNSIENVDEKNSLRVEYFVRLLSLTDVLIALIMSFWTLKSSDYSERLMGALSMNVLKSNDVLMAYRGTNFFLSHCFLNSLWWTMLSCLASVQGSAPSGDGMKCVIACGRMEGGSSFPSSPPIDPPTCYPHHLLVFPSFLPSSSFLPTPYQGTHSSMGAISCSLFPSSLHLPTSYLSPSPQSFQTPAALSWA